MSDRQRRLIELRGSAHEQGVAQGRTYRRRMPEVVDAMTRLGVTPQWMPAVAQRSMVRGAVAAGGRFYLQRHEPLLRHHAGGRHHEFLTGLAHGLDCSVSSAYGLNVYEVESCTVGFSLGCTSLAFPGAVTASGDPRLAYNHDFPPSFESFLTVRRSIPSPGQGYRSLHVGYGVMLGAIAGVNECGLAVSIDQAFATDISRLRPGLFPSMLVRECLDDCASVDDAIECIRQAPPTNGSMITVVDGSGDRAVIEFSATRTTVRRGDPDRILYTFNKYRVSEMEPVEIPVGALTKGLVPGVDLHAFNTSRTERFLSLDQPGKTYDDEVIQQLMADHGENGEASMNTICRHDDPLAETICTAIIDPVNRSMKVLFGKPCQARPEVFELLEAEDERACA